MEERRRCLQLPALRQGCLWLPPLVDRIAGEGCVGLGRLRLGCLGEAGVMLAGAVEANTPLWLYFAQRDTSRATLTVRDTSMATQRVRNPA